MRNPAIKTPAHDFDFLSANVALENCLNFFRPVLQHIVGNSQQEGSTLQVAEVDIFQ